MLPSRLARLFALLAVLFLTPVAVAAATPDQTTLPRVEIRYNAGGEDPEHGPNSFVIIVRECPPSWHVRYEWGSQHGQVTGSCGETRVSSLAPLGANEYPLRWQSCSVRLWKYPPRLHTECGEYHQDVVLTD